MTTHRKQYLRHRTVLHIIKFSVTHAMPIARARLVASRYVKISTPDNLTAQLLHSISHIKQSIGSNPATTLCLGPFSILGLRFLVSFSLHCVASLSRFVVFRLGNLLAGRRHETELGIPY